MSGQPNRTVFDMAKNRQAYLDNLNLRAKIDDFTLQGNKLYARTGAIPVQPTDTRTTSEKLADLYNIRAQIRSELLDLMSGDDAQKVVEGLDDNEAQFLISMLPTIKADLKPKFALGVPADIFNPYFQKLMKKFTETEGVDYSMQESTGQKMLNSQKVMLDNMADKTDISAILKAVSDVGLQNTALGKQLKVNLKNIEDVLDVLPETFNSINEANNSILKDQLTRTVADLIAELPSKEQIQQLLYDLDVAKQKRDNVTAEAILRKIQSISVYAGDIQEELRTLKFQQQQVNDSNSVPAQVQVTEAQALAPSNIIETSFRDVNYTYIPIDQLDAYNKTSSKKGVPNLVDYFKVMKVVNPTTYDTIVSVSDSTLKNKSKEQLVEFLRTNDKVIQQIWTGGGGQKSILDYGAVSPKKTRTGKGITGRGLKKALRVNLDHGMLPTAKYVPFGNYLINRQKLEDGILMIKLHTGQFIPEIKSKRISGNLTNVFKKIAGGELPGFNDYEKLDDDEREYIHYVAKKSNLADKLKVPAPKKDKTEQLINQFEIMRGEVMAGNDSRELLKKFKEVILEMSERKLIPRGQVTDLLMELTKFEI